jgi:hypothetical protein
MSFELDSISSGSIKSRDFLDLWSNCQFLKKHCTSCSKFSNDLAQLSVLLQHYLLKTLLSSYCIFKLLQKTNVLLIIQFICNYSPYLKVTYSSDEDPT